MRLLEPCGPQPPAAEARKYPAVAGRAPQAAPDILYIVDSNGTSFARAGCEGFFDANRPRRNRMSIHWSQAPRQAGMYSRHSDRSAGGSLNLPDRSGVDRGPHRSGSRKTALSHGAFGHRDMVGGAADKRKQSFSNGHPARRPSRKADPHPQNKAKPATGSALSAIVATAISPTPARSAPKRRGWRRSCSECRSGAASPYS